MSVYAFLLVAGCSVGWAGMDLLRKLLSPHLSPLSVVFVVALGQVPVLALWAAAAGGGSFGVRYALVAGASVLLNIVANVAFVAALRRSALSLTVPLLSLIPVFTAAFAWPLLGEVPRPVQWLGIALVVAGALLLGEARATRGGSLSAWWREVRAERGMLLMWVVAVAWSLTLPLDKLGVQEVGAARHSLVLCAGVSAGTLLLLVGLGEAKQLRSVGQPRVLGLVVVAALVGALALALQLLAIRIVLVGIVEAVKRAVGNLAALWLGAALFAEPVGWRKAVALGWMAAGVALILWP